MTIDSVTLFFVAGLVIYIIGVSWLLYLNLKYKKHHTSHTNSYYNSAAWAVFLSALGVFVTVVTGMIYITLTNV